MANQKLNEVTTVPTASINNVKTFLAVMNNGSIQQMSKEDMATVLGELNSNEAFFNSLLKASQSYMEIGINEEKILIDRISYGLLIIRSGYYAATMFIVVSPTGADLLTSNCHNNIISNVKDTTNKVNIYWKMNEGLFVQNKTNTIFAPNIIFIPIKEK